MAIALNVDIFDADGAVLVRHIFYGQDESEAEKWKEHHLRACSYFSQAEEEGRTGQFYEDLEDEDVPTESDYFEEEEQEDEEEDES